MMNIFKKLTPDQRERGVVFSSRLSLTPFEHKSDVIHEVIGNDLETYKKMAFLRNLDDPKKSYNIIRT